MSIMQYIDHYLYLNSIVPEKHASILHTDLIDLCVNRVGTYKKMQLTKLGSQQSEYFDRDELNTQMTIILTNNNLILYPQESLEKYKDDDQLSHHFLQIVYAQSPEHIRQYVDYEKQIFKSRLARLGNVDDKAREIMKKLNIKCEPVEYSEWKILKSDIENSYGEHTKEEQLLDNQNKYSKIPFQNFLSGLERKKFFLKKGIAYVHQKYLLQAAVDCFGDRIQSKLTKTSKLPQYTELIESDERIQQLVEKLPDVESNQGFDSQAKKIQGQFTINSMNIDQIAKQSFPMCMKYLYDKLYLNHHLKHYGRLQLTLFLKGAGLKCDDSLQFWKVAFSKGKEAANFESGYAKNILHSYGLTGGKVNYSAQSCSSIINKYQPNSRDEHQGCPFKSLSSNDLKKYLIDQGVDKAKVNEIAEHAKKSYQVACKKTFEAKRPNALEFIIEHPLIYFQKSMEYYKMKEEPTQLQQDGGSTKMQEEN